MSNLKVPKIYHAHNWRAVENPRLRARDTLKKVVHKVGVNVDYYNVSNVDKTVAVSKFIRDGILSTVYVDDKKIIEIPNSVDTEMFYPNTENDEREKSVIFVGRISPEKGIDDLLKSMAIVIREVRDAKLIIVGPRKFGIEHGTYDSYLLKLVHKLDIEKHVDFKYQITYNELRRLYSSVEVCVLPAVWNEPFGLVLIESMACETAVIGTAVGGIPEIITNGVNGFLIKPKDIKQLAEAIVQLLSDTNLARKMGIRGRKLVKKRYVWKINVEKFYKVYEDVIGK
jgi:glycosyltransferase involved in cell wall biosynthesis